MIKVASSLLDTASKWLEDNPTAATGLLTGGLGALGGFALTDSNPDESTGDSLKRRLRNALIVGGLAGGAGALGSAALSNFGTSHEAPLPPAPAAVKTRKYALDALGAGLGAYGGWALGDKLFLSTNLPGIGKKDDILALAGRLNQDADHGPGVALKAVKSLLVGANAIDAVTRAVGGNNSADTASKLRALGITNIPKLGEITKHMNKLPSWLNLHNIVRGTSAIGGAIAGGIGAHKLQDAFLDN